MNSTVISGTPRTSSMKPMQIALMIGSSERRPSANRTASGNENTMPLAARISVSGRPFHFSVSTYARPTMPPRISTHITGTPAAQEIHSHLPHSRVLMVAPINPSSSTIITSGRHCCSYG